jgi:hypothetical protein
MRSIIRNIAVLRITVSLGVLGMVLGATLGATNLALAGKGGGKGGGGGGGGGGGHGWGGGGGGHGWGGGAPHFSAAHYSGGHGHYSAHISSHASHWSGGHHYATRHSGHTHTAGINTRSNLSHSNLSHGSLSHSNVTKNALTNAGDKNHDKNLNSHVTPLKNASDPKNFGARRDFANKTAFNSFWHQGWHQNWWHHHNNFFHIGWIGPWFWPFAYGDFFYFALWPWDYWYYDPFWAYGYGDIYDAVFFPYSYDDYVQGPRAPERKARLKQGIVQGCNEEAGEVTGWPIDQIQAAVQPDQRQSQMLDDLGNAIVKAGDEIRAHCQTNVAFTPTTRLDQMHDRLGGLVDAVNVVSAPMSGFYDALSDEQKARFDHIAPRSARTARRSQAQTDHAGASPQAQCNSNIMAWPTDQIDRVVQPDDAQRAKLQALQSAASQAADTIKAACPADVPATPPARLTAVGYRLQAMLGGVETIQPALADFYNSLSDDQKARFNSMGRQLFAQNERNGRSE